MVAGVVALALIHYMKLMGLLKILLVISPSLATLLQVFGSLPLHCTKWNAEIHVFTSVPCTSDVEPKIVARKCSLSFDP